MRKKWPRSIQEYLLSLGAGFILALVFLELVPESFHAVGERRPCSCSSAMPSSTSSSTRSWGTSISARRPTRRDVSGVASFSTFAGLFIHAFFDGFAISGGMEFNFYLGLLIFFAVLLHKILKA